MSSFTFSLFTVLLALLLFTVEGRLWRGSLSGGDCPKVNTVPDFDLQKYLGEWYIQERVMGGLENADDQQSCARKIIEDRGDGMFRVCSTRTTGKGEIQRLCGWMYQPLPEELPGKLRFKYDKAPVGENRQVLSTDYTTYAVVYTCTRSGPFKFESGWIITREKTTLETVIQKGHKAFKDAGINFSFKHVEQDDSCVYEPTEDCIATEPPKRLRSRAKAKTVMP